MVTWAGTMVVAQKVTTTEELDKTMKKVQPALQATQKAIKGNDFAEASKQLAIVKQAIEESREFWVVHKKDDALKANTDTVEKIDEAQKVLTATAPDAQTALAALKQLGGACRSCHEVYRVRDADNNWVLKPGSIGG